MKPAFVYMTATSTEEARTIGKALVQERLAACANILDNMRSLYWWEGDVQEDAEVVLIAKTDEDRVPAIVERVQALHSADCPCVVSWPLQTGHEPFLQWLHEETRPE